MECGMTDPNVSDAERELMSAKSRVSEANVEIQRLRADLAAAREEIAGLRAERAWRPIKPENRTAEFLMVGQRGSSMIALAFYHGKRWRHAHSVDALCFEPNVYQPLPPPPEGTGKIAGRE